MIEVESIECHNGALIVMSFKVGSSTGKESESTSDYPVSQSKSINLRDGPFEEGDEVRPLVHGVGQLGKGPTTPDEAVIFKKNGLTARYDVSGIINFTKVEFDKVLKLPSASKLPWENWSGNIKHLPPTDGSNYYFAPNNLEELKGVVKDAVAQGVKVGVSGQRHSPTPLVTDDNSASPPVSPKQFLLDLSCYADLGPDGDQNMVIDSAKKQVTVNAGVREDDLDALLTQHNLMLKTVTAGGFFSIGGMTAVDVHGATVNETIFAGTAASFTILKADGSVVTIDENTAPVGDWKPIQFARVSLGGIGVVTSVTLNVQERRYKASLSQGTTETYKIDSKAAFVEKFQELLKHDRVETFYDPYVKKFLPLCWDVTQDPKDKDPNKAVPAASACTLASEDDYGAPFVPGAGIIEGGIEKSQESILGAPIVTALAMSEIQSQVKAANKTGSELWLAKALRATFMAYFIKLPDFSADGLGRAWDALQVVGDKVREIGGAFHTAAPLEFRFMKGGDSAMSGAYSENPDEHFINIEVIGFVDKGPSSSYPTAVLQFFADVEREWVKMGGFPHNGKLYGFYDPSAAPGTFSKGALNPAYLTALRERRGERLVAFKSYLDSQDPGGLFRNDYLSELLGD